MDAQQALRDGHALTSKAETTLEQTLRGEDDVARLNALVKTLKFHLADTEPLGAAPGVQAMRARIRRLTEDLERKAITHVASEKGMDPPVDLEGEDMARALVTYGKEFCEMGEMALRAPVRKNEDLGMWEDPLKTLKTYLADSEPYAGLHPKLPKVRAACREVALTLEQNIHFMRDEWRASALVADEDDN